MKTLMIKMALAATVAVGACFVVSRKARKVRKDFAVSVFFAA